MHSRLAGAESGLVGLWSFDGDARDKSVSANDGTMHVAPDFIAANEVRGLNEYAKVGFVFDYVDICNG